MTITKIRVAVIFYLLGLVLALWGVYSNSWSITILYLGAE
jgi:uncharacterized membrane protein YoaT (DUF817 family)